jgi:predicted transposase YdaD
MAMHVCKASLSNTVRPYQGRKGREGGRKEGGREGGREEGRKEGRKEGIHSFVKDRQQVIAWQYLV